MTEPKAPSFNGVEIRKGDAGTLNVIFDEPDPSDGTIRIYVDDGAVAFDAWVGVGSIASHTPAPRPLVPGPALLDDRKHHAPVTVLFIDLGEAWFRYEDGSHGQVPVARLRNTEGTAS